MNWVAGVCNTRASEKEEEEEGKVALYCIQDLVAVSGHTLQNPASCSWQTKVRTDFFFLSLKETLLKSKISSKYCVTTI